MSDMKKCSKCMYKAYAANRKPCSECFSLSEKPNWKPQIAKNAKRVAPHMPGDSHDN